MVLYVQRYEILPGKTEEFIEWAKAAIPQILAVPGLVEMRSYRTQAGNSQVVTTYEFADMAAWAAWQYSETMQQMLVESRASMMNVSAELWGPSPVVPEPLRPGG